MRPQKNDAHKNGMKKSVYREAVFVKFHGILKKKPYHNCDIFSSKWTQINKQCTKLNRIYNNLQLEKQSGANDFDLFKSAKKTISGRDESCV